MLANLTNRISQLTLMSPAFTGFNYMKDPRTIAARASKLGLSPIIEELAELTLNSSVKKSRDDSSIQPQNRQHASDPRPNEQVKEGVMRNLE